jgi:hypothetical protein
VVTALRHADDLIGTFRSFGEFGPVYQVVRKVDESSLHVVVLQTGEALDYPVNRALNDPEAE